MYKDLSRIKDDRNAKRRVSNEIALLAGTPAQVRQVGRESALLVAINTLVSEN